MRAGWRFCLVLLAATLWGEDPATLEQRLMRVAEEAEIFGRLSTKVIGVERLEQVALEPPPRLQLRNAPPEPKYRTRHIVSEYGFSTLEADANNLHEMRQVLEVDGRKVTKPGKLRETLLMGLKGDTDRVKKKMLREFQSLGLREAATDFGQVLLLFTRRQLENYSFRFVRKEFIGADRVLVLDWAQKEEGPAMTVFEGKQVVRHKLGGQLWMRESDGVPLRISLSAARMEKKTEIRYEALVDYEMSSHGLMLPAAVVYREMAGGQMLVENRFRYEDFKMFGASSDVKFETVDPPPKP